MRNMKTKKAIKELIVALDSMPKSKPKKAETVVIRNYEETVEQFKETDCGRYGKAFELNVKHYLNGNRGNSNIVSAKGKTDVKFHGNKIEIKSNCGELDKIEKNHFVVYTMNNKEEYKTPEKAKVIPANEFTALIVALGLLRVKKSTGGYIKVAIQTYSNSKRKKEALERALAVYPTLEEWKATH